MVNDIHIASRRRTLVDIAGFEVPEGKITFLLGESGIGKSLMSKAIYGLLDPRELDVTISGMTYEGYLAGPAVPAIQRTGFFVFQEPSSHLNPLLTLGTQLREGSLAQGQGRDEVLQQLWETAPQGELQELLRVYPKPHRPSGGEKQRMLLAMAFTKIDLFLASADAGDQPLFIFDEPTGSLDNVHRNLFLSLLFARFRRRPFTVLLITHDYSMIGEVSRSHRDLLPSIRFREVLSDGRRLRVEPFLPETYLDWLKLQRPASRGVRSDQSPLLVVEGGLEVFGRSLSLSADPAGGERRPLRVTRGTMAYIKAPSGVGKTSFMKAIMGLIPARGLRMQLGPHEITSATSRRYWQREVWGKRLTMVFQHADEALNPESTVRETFLGLPSRRMTTERIVGILAELFERAADPAFLHARIKTLSGGQKQRVNLLRGLALDTDVLIVDEPLNGLDFESTTKVIALLRLRQEQGKGILMISHNEEILDPLIAPEDVYYLHAETHRLPDAAEQGL